MNHFVPEFDMDEDYSIPASSGPPRQKNMQDEEILELLWQNGQVVVQSQNPRSQIKSSTQPLRFPPEDELTSWLQFPLVEPPFERELTFSFPPPGSPSPLLHHCLTQAPIQSEAPVAEVNFPFSKTAPMFTELEQAISSRNNEMRESMVDSSDTPANRLKPNIPTVTRRAAKTSDWEIPRMSVSREVSTGDVPRGSGRGGSTADLMTSPPADDRKRKGREPVDDTNAEFQSEDAEIESYEPKKQSRGPTNRRSRAAEVHNLSERKRRDRINERMKTLQQLIPRCSKTDKASTLDETIQYLKSLQMQVQMMSSMGCGMVPLMLPGVQQYMPSLGMEIGMGINMEMGMNQPMMQFPNVLSGSAVPTMVGGAPSQLNPRFPLQHFQTLTVPVTDQSRIQQVSNNHEELNMARISTLSNPYQQSNNIHQVPMQIAQNQPIVQPSWQAEQTEVKSMKTL